MALPDFSENTSDLALQSRRRVRTKTYVVAVYLSLAVALVPLAAIVSVFWLRHRVDIDTNSPRLLAPQAVPLQPAPPPPAPVAPPAPELPVLKPSLGPARIPVPADPAERIAADRRQARLDMDQGRYDLAQAALLEAESLNPRDPDTLRAKAELAEAERKWPEAVRAWKAVLALGDEAGPAAATARERLARIPQPAEAPPGGIAFRVGPTEQTPGPNGGFILRIPIAPLSALTEIDPGKISIKFYFYDETGEGIVVPTNARLQVAFENLHATWEHGRTETLRAVYERPAGGSQHFYGTIFRLYYNGVLQAERSQPATLLSLFPSNPAP